MPRPNLLNPAWLRHASQALLAGRVQRVDMGLCAGRYWLLWAGIGVDSFIVTQIEPRGRLFKRFGSFGYGVKALLTVPKFRGMRASVAVDGDEVDGDFLLVTAVNCRLFAGGALSLNQAGVLDDGEFEVWLLHGRQWPTLLRHTLEITLQHHLHSGNATVKRGRSLRVETRPCLPYHLDGEPVGHSPFPARSSRGRCGCLRPAPHRATCFAIQANRCPVCDSAAGVVLSSGRCPNRAGHLSLAGFTSIRYDGYML
ncbi:MAG: hypothetical protein HC802_16360 [Caldilineaceae bacterium]|nr:hypothetical protein [Caldilineaceae bacterium]